MIHSFQTEDAAKYGLIEAVMLNNFRYWIGHNQANGTHQHDGRTWTYNSVKAFSAHFPYLTGNQVRRCLDSLIAQGVLVRGNYNQSTYDKTSWFAFADESFSQIHLANLPNGVGKSAASHTNSKHTLKTQIGEKKAPAAPAFTVPEWINAQHWDAWHSCDKRKKATPAQKQIAIDKLAKWREAGIDHALALENAALAGWQGLFKPDAPAAATTPARRTAGNTNKHAAAAATIFEGVWDHE